MEDLEIISCQIIAASGGAKSSYVEAIELAKKGQFQEAEKLIKEGAQIFLQGHEAHAKLLQLSAEGKLAIPLLLIHAEDQMMNCETMKIVATEMVEQYRMIAALKQMVEESKGETR